MSTETFAFVKRRGNNVIRYEADGLNMRFRFNGRAGIVSIADIYQEGCDTMHDAAKKMLRIVPIYGGEVNPLRPATLFCARIKWAPARSPWMVAVSRSPTQRR